MGNHRAERRGRAAERPAQPSTQRTTPAGPAGPVTPSARPGGRRADRRRRRTPLSIPGTRVPAIPALVGAAALLVAGAGAVGLHRGDLPGSGLELSSGGKVASMVSGAGASGLESRDPRTRALSRDSERQALRNAQLSALKKEAEQQSHQRSQELTSLARSAEHRADQIAKNRWVLPTEGYHLTARFGQTSGLWSSFHTGLDFAAPSGTPIFAVADGRITEDGYEGAYGNKTVETLSDGTEIWYCHQTDIDVNVGEDVHQGEVIGHVGSTGNTTGPHVHIEVRPDGGDPVDPYPEFVQHGVTP